MSTVNSLMLHIQTYVYVTNLLTPRARNYFSLHIIIVTYQKMFQAKSANSEEGFRVKTPRFWRNLLPPSSGLKYLTTRRHNPEDTLNIHCHKSNLGFEDQNENINKYKSH
jgi:hypothetical protein